MIPGDDPRKVESLPERALLEPRCMKLFVLTPEVAMTSVLPLLLMNEPWGGRKVLVRDIGLSSRCVLQFGSFDAFW